jgi:hypothetical protein
MIAFLGGSAEAAKKRRRGKKAVKPETSEAIVIGANDDVGAKEKSTKKEKLYDFSDFSIEGKLRTPQLLYFLGRARQELERASLEKRTFIPEMVRSVDEGGL